MLFVVLFCYSTEILRYLNNVISLFDFRRMTSSWAGKRELTRNGERVRKSALI